MSARCWMLAWDTEFFGQRIARLDGPHLAAADLHAIEEWCAANQVDCLTFLADPRCADTAAAAQRAGFAHVDLRATYERSPAPAAPTFAVRPFRESDIEPLVRIARGAHTDTRFYFDPHFDRAKCALLYDTWLRKDCAGAAQHVLVGERRDEPAGYLTCHLDDASAGTIGLIAVDPRFHGQGIGRAMLDAALTWFAEQGATGISVVTQARNVPAQRLYQTAGFRLRTVESWYHRWFTG